MTNRISVRTLAALTAIIGLMVLALLTLSGNQAQAQSLPSLEFTANNIPVDEPDQSPHRVSVVFTVQLSQASNDTVTVRYRTVDVTAEAGEGDYAWAGGALTFSPGITERTITVTVLDDTVVEQSERFWVELFEPSNAVLGLNEYAQVYIADHDESAPYNLIAPATVLEGQGSFTAVIETANSPVVDLDFRFSVIDLPGGGTAIAGVHYQDVSLTPRFTPGQTRHEFTVDLIDDDNDSPDRTFELRLLRGAAANHPRVILGTTEQVVTIIDDDPGMPANLEMTYLLGDEDQGYVAVLEWDYPADAEGYVLESQDGTGGDWNCVVAGSYAPGHPGGSSVISTTRGGWMDGSDEWRFRVRLFNSQPLSHADEVTCGATADYGYIFSAAPNEGYNLSQPITIGPLEIPAADPDAPPNEAPTGLAITAGAKHRDVEITWDAPPADSNVTGFALYRQWRGHQDAPNLCLYWHTNSTNITSYQDGHIAAYDSASNRNQYIYTLYPLNENVPVTPGGGCDDDEPTSVPSASATATLAVDTRITPNADGDLEYLNPPAPTGITLTPRLYRYHNQLSHIKIRWEDVDDAPGYRVRYRKEGDTAWRERTSQPRAADPWPNMHNAGPGAPNYNLARAKSSIIKLDNDERYEVQVATCTDTSCDATGPWSASQYATSL